MLLYGTTVLLPQKPGDGSRFDITVRSCPLTRDTYAGEPTQSFVWRIAIRETLNSA